MQDGIECCDHNGTAVTSHWNGCDTSNGNGHEKALVQRVREGGNGEPANAEDRQLGTGTRRCSWGEVYLGDSAVWNLVERVKCKNGRSLSFVVEDAACTFEGHFREVQMGLVQLAGRQIDADLARHEPAQFSGLMQKARADVGWAECLCRPGRKLVIRERGGYFFLAVWPEDGPNHARSCPFHRDPVEEGEGGESQPAIRLEDDGYSVRLATSLRRRTERPAPTSSALEGGRSSAPSRARTSLLGLLQFLWQEAKLNRWAGGWQRDYWRVRLQLQAAVREGRIGRNSLESMLHVIHEYKQSSAVDLAASWAKFKEPLLASATMPTIESRLVLGEVREHSRTEYGFRFLLRHQREPLYLSEELQAQLAKRFARAVALSRAGGAEDHASRAVLLGQVEATPRGNLRLVDAALMVVSREYIPCDSQYEVDVANALVKAGRSFSKPLRLDVDDSVLPDFVLHDCEPAIVMEIFGMNSTNYLSRKAQKIALYESQGRRLWKWDPHLKMAMPPFPPPRS